ncbi:MAG TPA: pyridoxal-dependent decarboxylase [Fimbriimonadaceae bacterium]|nr:pyridoxal-dependent decarboxylase [Fimbriimonadaceae bacterium]
MHDVKSGWFAGPKAENADWFALMLERVATDYYFWRKNYFPEDGAVLTTRDQRHQDEFRDQFEDLLTELLGRLKADCPFYSPRYAGHMIAEQTLPSIAGYFAAMLYNPNNVTSEAAPVTVDLEIEAAGLIAKMLGHGPGGWAHLCSGGTVANFEALWVARNCLLLPHLVSDVAQRLNIQALPCGHLPSSWIASYASLFSQGVDAEIVHRTIHDSPANASVQGWTKVCTTYGVDAVLIVPETYHYCFDKALDLLGLGRQAIRRVRVNQDFRMDVEDLKRVLDLAESHGQTVLAVVCVMGTTEEGAVDPLNEIVNVRNQRVGEGRPGFWLHADAAYGGYLRSMMIPERIGLGDSKATAILKGQQVNLELHLPETNACDAFECLGQADSITVDPHKLGYVPYPAGAISFADARTKPLLRQVAPYLQESSMAFVDEVKSKQVGMYALEGSKPGAVAAGVWMSHRLIPLDTSGHGVLVRETIRNACKLHALLSQDLSASCRVECLCPPGSNIVCYAFVPKASSNLAAINRLNRELYTRLSIGSGQRANIYAQKFFVSRTTLLPGQYGYSTVVPFLERLGVSEEEYNQDGVFLLRSVLMNPWYRASLDRGKDVLAGLVEHLFETAEAILEEQETGG